MINGLSKKTHLEFAEVLGKVTEEIFQAGFEAGKASAASVEYEAEFRTEKRYAANGERILITDARNDYNSIFIGKTFTVVHSDSFGSVDVKELERNSRNWNFIETEYEVIVEPEVLSTPNQQRAELIQRAREFVEEHKRDLPGEYDCRVYGNQTCRNYFYETEFHVKNNKVTAVVYRLSYNRRTRMSVKPLIGRAKCAPGDVFNEWIGKAIALARALEIDVPQEFLQAVQPTEVVVGMVVQRNDFYGINKGIRTVESFNKYGDFFSKERYGTVSPSEVTILDDTNAIYEEVAE